MWLLFLFSFQDKLRGVTISCQTYGKEWATPGFAEELKDLNGLGVNSVAIHPYAGIRSDGSVSTRYQNGVPDYVTLPQKTATEQHMVLVMKPHLAYWRSGFSWRGEIQFEGEALTRFQSTYKAFILTLAKACPDVPYFVIATELEQMAGPEQRPYWVALIKEVRKLTKAKIGFAANWDRVEKLSFWDELDFIGVQAYYPLSDLEKPSRADLEKGWDKILLDLKSMSDTHKKPVLFTELGYPQSLDAAREPWSYHEALGTELGQAQSLQALCYDVALEKMGASGDWFLGCLLWKWFVGDTRHENFVLDQAHIRHVLSSNWLPTPIKGAAK